MIRTLLLTPTAFPKLTGNAVTVDRIHRGLTGKGVTSRIIDLSENPTEEVLKKAKAFKPDIIHCFHAYRAGSCGLKVMEDLGIPMITTITGTDINIDFHNDVRHDAILNVLRQSDAVTVFNEQIRYIVEEQEIDPSKISVIHQSVSLPRGILYNYRKQWNLEEGDLVFLLFGAIRKVKQWPYAIEVMESVRKVHRCFRLFLAGPILEEKEFHRIKALIRNMPWAEYLGTIERARVSSLLLSIDVMLNTSSSECESNAMIEAMSCGKTVIGKNISGNVSLLTDETGITFHKKNDLLEKIILLMEHRERMNIIGRKAAQFLQQRFSHEKEISSYINLYQSSLLKKNDDI